MPGFWEPLSLTLFCVELNSNPGCTNRRKIGRGCLLRSALPRLQSFPLVSGTLLSHHPSLMEAVSSQCYQLIVHIAHPCLDPFGKYLHRQLHPLWQSSGECPASQIFHLTPSLKTYGEGSSLFFSCQHGPVECEVCSKDLKVRGYLANLVRFGDSGVSCIQL